MTDTPPPRPAQVVLGVDTHLATHHIAVLDAVTGQVLGDRQIPATTAGYRQGEAFVASLGQARGWGIEGTNSYGAGLTRHLRAGGHDVLEIIRPNRSTRRLKGKSDPLDAITAARQVLTGGDLPTPKTSDGPVESLRVLATTRASAVKASTAVLRQIAMLLVSAPAPLRESLQGLTRPVLLERLASSHPGTNATAGVQVTTAIALKSLARRHRDLSEEIDQLTTMTREVIEQVAPALLATKGVGVVTAARLLITVGDNPERIRNKAAFAAMCGVSPIPASSGKTTRMRLNRGGDRQANCAIHQIALVRMTCDQRTKDYIAKKRTEGKTTREAIRCLKRHLANELFTTITRPPTVPDICDLRPTRQALGLSLTTVATHFNVWPAHISTIERGTRRDDDLAHRYRQWLLAA